MARRRRSGAWWLAILASCSVELDVPRDAEISCERDADCPERYLCSPIDRRCTHEEDLAGEACAQDADCDDGLYCNGVEICSHEHCKAGQAPCGSPFECVEVTCVETARACNVVPNHALCDEESYCEPSSGCAPGRGCEVDADCQDGSFCNGEEVCLGLRCAAGSIPSVDDGDSCTLDGCDDTRISSGQPPVFHVANPTSDGNVCTRPDTGGLLGICVAAKGGCVESVCGDGVVDTGATEICDDGDQNRDSWLLERRCATDCQGYAPYCGDGQQDDPDEECDDGNVTDDMNGCDVDCTRNDVCGDGIPQLLYEECDDGNDGNDCDGCRDGCLRGCECDPDDCAPSTWCDLGVCEPCDNSDHCGPSCVACASETPACTGQTGTCVCTVDSCFPHGWECLSGSCVACDEPTRCGPDCAACADPTPDCGGEEVGCVVHADGGDDGCSGQLDGTPCVAVTDPDRSFDICLDETCVSPGCGEAYCTFPGPFFPMPDSNQRTCDAPDPDPDPANEGTCHTGTTGCVGTAGDPTCSATPYCGQDAQYGWDLTNALGDRYEKTEPISDEPLVVDHVTGLVWQGCPAGLTGLDCDIGNLAAYDWDNALAYCDALEFGGYADWRLPDYVEMFTLYDYESPILSGDYFLPIPAVFYWTASATHNGLGRHTINRYMNSANGDPTYTYYVHCVRGHAGGQARFSNDGASEPVVLDAITGLEWQGCIAGLTGSGCTGTVQEHSMADAMAYCEALAWGGKDDWRLPSIRELFSIVDLRRRYPAFDPTAFPNTPSSNARYWSSTFNRTGVSCVLGWQVQSSDGQKGIAHLDTSYAVRCVRTP